MTEEQVQAELRKRELVGAASTDLVNRFSNEIDYIFVPRYTDYGTKRVQTNPFAILSEAEKTEVIVEALAMVLGQIAAGALVSSPQLDVNTLYGKLSRRVRIHGDAYHQQFLQTRETQNEQNSSQGTQGRNDNADAAGAAGQSESSGNQAG